MGVAVVALTVVFAVGYTVLQQADDGLDNPLEPTSADGETPSSEGGNGTDADGTDADGTADPDETSSDGDASEPDASDPPPGNENATEALNKTDAYLIGAWLGDWPSEQNGLIEAYEQGTGSTADIVDVYVDWSTPFAAVEPPVRHIARSGAIPQVTWEAHGLTTQDIADGSKTITLNDGTETTVGAYLDAFGAATCQLAKDEGTPVLLRPMHEMNGGWFSWGMGYTAEDGSQPNTPESYKAAWQRIHQAFTQDCQNDQVRFIWAVNHFSQGGDFTSTFPGDAYVDYLGVDGYNWGTQASWGWQSFDTVMAPAYCAVTSVSDKPVLIAEWGSVEEGGDKAAWISDAFTQINERYPRVRAMVWLDERKHEVQTDTTMDWRLDSSPEALEAYSQGIQDLRAAEPLAPTSQVPPGPACSG